MFALLSNQDLLIEKFKQYSTQDLETVCENITFMMESLNVEVSQLLSNRRDHGALLPLKNKLASNITLAELKKMELAKLLLNQSHFIAAINTMCLSEVIVVRNNFSDCLEVLAEQGALPLPIVAENSEMNDSLLLNTKNITSSTAKNNISPIHLTKIKQRLAKAVQTTSDKKTQVKNKLNGLLDQTRADKNITCKQA